MSDAATTVQVLREIVRRFAADRDWEQFHSPKNLSMGMAVEAAELMEHFLWVEGDVSRRLADDPEKKTQIADEIADVAAYVFNLCNVLDIDLSEAFRAKMLKNEAKYPVEEYRGRYSR